ncbi:MAG: hypothetical protein ABW072_11275 [Sedimenticola sp.]
MFGIDTSEVPLEHAVTVLGESVNLMLDLKEFMKGSNIRYSLFNNSTSGIVTLDSLFSADQGHSADTILLEDPLIKPGETGQIYCYSNHTGKNHIDVDFRVTDEKTGEDELLKIRSVIEKGKTIISAGWGEATYKGVLLKSFTATQSKERENPITATVFAIQHDVQIVLSDSVKSRSRTRSTRV